MPRAVEGPRLYLRERAGRKPVYVILDTHYEESTGCGPSDRGGAEKLLARYLSRKHTTKLGTHDPAILPISDVLSFYAKAKQPSPDASKLRLTAFEVALYQIDHLLRFFGTNPTKDIRGATCRDYVRWRTHEGAPLPHWPERRARKVIDQTARRELAVLGAAINLYHKEYGLDVVPIVTLPALAPSKRKALTHNEAARLLAGALGFYKDEDGTPRRRPQSTRTSRKRTARLILIGLYSGSRSGVILTARWVPSVDAPWIDVERGILHRRGSQEAETKKRRPPARIPPRLLAHLRRWRKMDMEPSGDKEPCTYVLAKNGKALAGKIRKGWIGARSDGGIGPEVTPHVLRHTAGTWLAQGGVSGREAADFMGMTEAVFEATYYSAHPDFQTSIGPAFDSAKRKASLMVTAQNSPNNVE